MSQNSNGKSVRLQNTTPAEREAAALRLLGLRRASTTRVWSRTKRMRNKLEERVARAVGKLSA